MRAEKDFKTGRRKKSKKRILKLVLALLAVLILLVVFLVPAFVSSEKGRKIILAKINRSIDGEADFASLSMGWWKGVKVKNFSFSGSAEQILVEIKRIATRPHYGSILMGDLSFGKTEILEPQVEINLERWQRKPAKGPEQTVSEGKKRRAVTLPIKKIDMIVTGGNLKVTDTKAKTVELSQIESKVNLRPLGQGTTFNIIATVADKGRESKISAQGKVRPKKKTGWSFKGTSGDFTVEVNDLDLASLGPILALGGIDIQAKGRVSANLKSEIKDGRIEDLSGTITGRDLDITGGKLKGDRFKTSALDVGVKLSSEKEIINIDRLEVHSDWLDAEVNGVVPKTFKSLAEFVKPDSVYSLRGRFECDLAQALSQMPRTFGLKEGMKVTSGRLSGNIETSAKAGRKEISGQGSLVGLAGVVDGKTIALSEPVRAAVEITSDKSGINFDKLDVSASFCNVSCAGSSKLLRYGADVDLAKLQSELGQFVDIGEYRMAGELFSKGEVSSSKDRISAVGSSVVKDLRLSSAEGVSAFEPKADMDFSIVVDTARDIIDVNFIRAKASLGEVSVKDSVVPLSKKADKPMKLAVSANNVDLEKLQPFAVLFGSFPKEMQLGGIAESNISISSKKDSYKVVTDSTKVANLKVHYPGREPFEQKEVFVVFDAEVNPVEKSIAVKELELISPQIKIRKGNFSKTTKGGKTKIKGQVDCEYDLSAASTIAGLFLPKGLKLKGERKQTIEFSSEYPAGKRAELLANLSTGGKLGFDWAYYKGLTFSPTEVAIQVENGLLTIAPFSANVNGGKFSFAGKINFKEKPIRLRASGPTQIIEKVNINDEVCEHLLMYLNPIFVSQTDVTGVSNFHCEKLSIPLGKGTKDALEVVGTVGIDNMHLEAVGLLGLIMSRANVRRYLDLTLVPTRFELEKGVLSYDDMQLNVDEYPVNFSGKIGPDIKLPGATKPDKKLDMMVTTPYVVTFKPKLGLKTVKVGEVTDKKRIPVVLGGMLRAPTFRLEKVLGDVLKQALEELLKQQLEERLREKIFEGLDELFK